MNTPGRESYRKLSLIGCQPTQLYACSVPVHCVYGRFFAEELTHAANLLTFDDFALSNNILPFKQFFDSIDGKNQPGILPPYQTVIKIRHTP